MTAAHGVAPQGLHDADDAISVVSNALLAVALGQVLSVPSQPAACQSTSVSRWRHTRICFDRPEAVLMEAVDRGW